MIRIGLDISTMVGGQGQAWGRQATGSVRGSCILRCWRPVEALVCLEQNPGLGYLKYRRKIGGGVHVRYILHIKDLYDRNGFDRTYSQAGKEQEPHNEQDAAFSVGTTFFRIFRKSL